MQLKTIYNLCDRIAPFRLSDEYCSLFGAYDNSGILVDCGEEITGVLFALDLTVSAVNKAKELGTNLIVTHHPAIYAPLKRLSEDDPTSRAVLEAIRANISVLSAHLNLDCAQGGIDEQLMWALGGKEGTVMHPLSHGGYGRAYDVNADMDTVVALAEEKFGSKRHTVYGNEKKITRIASFCGAGMDEGTLAFAKAQGAQLIVTSDAKHHLILSALESGMNVLLLTHYAAETYGFEKYYEKLKEKLELPCEFYVDERLF